LPNIRKKLKTVIAKELIKRKNKKAKFDVDFAENYRLPQDAPEHYNNSYYFTGHAEDGHSFLARLAFRGNGEVEVWFALNIPGRGLFNYTKNIDQPREGIASGPLKFTCLEPAKRWKIEFSSKLEKGEEEIDIDFQGIFHSDLPLFNFGTDTNPLPMARSLAQEKWSKDFFHKLKSVDQVHIEQCGVFEGYYVLDGEKKKLKMRSIRDHSFGPRDWSFMHRHVWLVITLENGTYFNFSLVEYPILKGLVTGFHMSADKTITVVDGTAIDDIWSTSEIPNNFTFEAILEDGKKVKASCSFEQSLTWLMSGVYEITEGLADFVINGVKGKGIAEFGHLKS